MKRSDKNEFVKKLKKELEDSSSVIVSHYAGLSVIETDDLRKSMRDNGAKFKVTKNRLTKLALTDTKYESITDLFNGPTAIAFSNDPIAPSRVSVDFEKKFKNFKIVGGAFEGEKIDLDKIQFLASLPSLDEVRGKLVGLILAPAQKIASILQEPGGQLARVINSRSESLGKSN
ncbi:MAG: 50S ribosomal protein L10 [Alphaproteobacteria bacterium MarineAlpha5_Bin8]|nr:MAG: 50S ribosomal protein L10 [Alphaproteobacteria bacterium MarineAlpha5_Bin7]PPR48061.1 MAG: 50S ribosomal protein L10 [Alphaproteobacteria bacterium MarineAlpha5_Bin8]